MKTNPTQEERSNLTRPSFECEICQDEEWVLIQEFDDNGKKTKDYARPCECAAKKRVKRLMSSSKITEEFQRKTFSNFEQNGRPQIVLQAFQTARDYVINYEEIKGKRRNSIALLGRPGCGKTHLLMAVANNLISKGVEVVYFPWVEGFNEIKDDFDKMEERMSRLRRCEVLYIDDMFKGRKEPTDFQLEQLFGIVNFRYLENKPIMISSEKTMEQICEFDEGTGSRINEMCRDYKKTLTGGIELNYRFQ
ncbi:MULTISPECIES: ATP-binding protein [Paenibacillus]|uniref:ATP-binding protein n=1 Tax=Paenibacillus TaxID=44249 RepID=UPI001F4591AD|nr:MULTISPECIES: ATP-binding protein [Paenibacillus]